jgi:hypothetical protein
VAVKFAGKAIVSVLVWLIFAALWTASLFSRKKMY